MEKRKAIYHAIRWRLLSVYRRIFSVVLLVNLATLAIVCWGQWKENQQAERSHSSLLSSALTAASINITVAIAIRNEHVVNMLFRIFVVATSLKAPLILRRQFAKIYCFGGMHSGCAVSGTLWYLAYNVTFAFDLFNINSKKPPGNANVTLALSFLVSLLLVTLIAFAHPNFRTHLHDYFEVFHRYGGWTVLLLFWVQVLLFCIEDAKQRNMPMALALIKIPAFWMLMIMTSFVIYPWARLREVEVDVEKLSRHAVRIHFKNEFMQPCRTIRVSNSPLKEIHPFATIPEPEGKPGYSIIVSRAGDWTSDLIDGKIAQRKLWVRGRPTWGVLRVALMFRPVVIVATGSGIGPCLSLFNCYPGHPMRILWSTKTPLQTYGQGIIDTVRRSDPNARIIDTTQFTRRPDMVAETKALYHESNAEAVVIISNPSLTKEVVHALECEGIPAFGPIWDS